MYLGVVLAGEILKRVFLCPGVVYRCYRAEIIAFFVVHHLFTPLDDVYGVLRRLARNARNSGFSPRKIEFLHNFCVHLRNRTFRPLCHSVVTPCRGLSYILRLFTTVPPLAVPASSLAYVLRSREDGRYAHLILTIHILQIEVQRVN